MRLYPSIDDARRAFDRYAESDPRLLPLWDLCRQAAPPSLDDDDDNADAYDSDPFELDPVTPPELHDDWCAEDFFLDHVKSRLLLLVGSHRPGADHPLHSHEAFEEVYDLLLTWALPRTCACCSLDASGDRRTSEPVHP